MADLKTTIKPIGKLKSSLGASSMNVTLGRAVDWNQNDETANDYVKNRPGAYTIPNSVDIEWDGNLEGKEVIWLNTRPVNGLKFGFVKIADEAPPIEKFAAKDENAEATSYKARSITVSQRADGTISESDETVELTVDASGKYYKLYNDIVFVLADSAEANGSLTYTKGIWCYTATRDTTQPQGTVLKQYVRRIASTDGTVAKIPKKYLEVEDPPVKDVQIAGTSILLNGVANVPKCQGDNYGVVRAASNKYGSGISANDSGILYTVKATDSQIANRQSDFMPITPTSIDYAVKAAMTDGKGAAWTAAEQQAARDRLGLDKTYELIEEIVLEEEVMYFTRKYEPNGTAYCFKKMFINITTPKSEKSGSIYSYFNNAIIGLSMNSIVSNYAEGGIAQTYARIANGFLDGYGVGAPNVTTSSNLIRYVTPRNAQVERTWICSMAIRSTTNIPVNTKIQIYGVRP